MSNNTNSTNIREILATVGTIAGILATCAIFAAALFVGCFAFD